MGGVICYCLQFVQLYRDDPEWDDVQPLPLTEDEQAGVKIATTDTFNDAFMYLRAIIQANEYSERAFKLNTRCTELNPANYTVWVYRRALLKALGKNLDEEFRFIEETIEDNPKNYQVWQHRRTLVEWTNDPSRELAFTARIFEEDNKNYHAWQHRQWVVDKFNLYSERELDFVKEMFLQDLRNNSAWNYRYFILQGLNKLNDEKTVNEEINLVEMLIKTAPNNESAWNYLEGILIEKGVSSRPDVFEFCEELYKEKKPPLCISFMVDYLMDELDKKVDVEKKTSRIRQLLRELKTLDPIRVKYWEYKEKVVNNLMTADYFHNSYK
uniref:Protein farnesyltransferase/geranylgeranyltransferase type-1 subunit alpha n=1 Tax=Syphacia muris TaxID=451379 RepID=A0A0N5AME1_9BILA